MAAVDQPKQRLKQRLSAIGLPPATRYCITFSSRPGLASFTTVYKTRPRAFIILDERTKAYITHLPDNSRQLELSRLSALQSHGLRGWRTSMVQYVNYTLCVSLLNHPPPVRLLCMRALVNTQMLVMGNSLSKRWHLVI